MKAVELIEEQYNQLRDDKVVTITNEKEFANGVILIILYLRSTSKEENMYERLTSCMGNIHRNKNDNIRYGAQFAFGVIIESIQEGPKILEAMLQGLVQFCIAKEK